MAYIGIIGLEDAEPPLSELYQQAQDRAGYVANIIRIMSQDARSCGASMGFYISLMKTKNSLSFARKEMLATVVSNANDCFY